MPVKESRLSEVSGRGHSKVPEVTVAFWIIKIAATTLGETGGDAVSMSMNLGYAVTSVIFVAVFVVAVAAQIAAKRFIPCSIGWSSSPRRRSARPWPTSPTARSASAMWAARRSCSRC